MFFFEPLKQISTVPFKFFLLFNLKKNFSLSFPEAISLNSTKMSEIFIGSFFTSFLSFGFSKFSQRVLESQ